MEYILLAYFGLFVVCFLSSTILPMTSAGALLLMLSQQYDPLNCLLVATIGNSLGGLTNYGIGLLGNPLWFKRFGINEAKLLTFEHRIQKRGYLLAFLSWIPFIGDPLTVGLGFFRVPFIPVLLFLVLGKFLRYLVFVIPFL